MRPRLLPRALVALSLLLGLGPACGSPPAPVAPVEKAPEIDADPVALLPAGAVGVLAVDVRAVLASPGAGKAIADLVSPYLGPGDAGFDPVADVDRALVATYSPATIDVSALLLGRFDAARIAASAQRRAGPPVTRAPYAGFDTYAAGPVVWCVLTPRTLVTGTSDGVRRVLDRAAARKTDRALPGWMVDAFMAPGAAFAGAADLASQPVSLDRLGIPSGPWVDGARSAKIAGKLEDPGLRVDAAVTYADAAHAAAVADEARSKLRWVKLLGPILGGISLDDVRVAAEGPDVRAQAAIDDRSLARLLAMARRLQVPN